MPAKKKQIKIEPNVLSRPPIVAVMGHVDHGKTTLLDAIRSTDVAGKEHGGITQHIGAYQLEVETKEGKRKITFIDTPGHEAFAKMRSRGANVTDIAVIVIDAKDGPMPQTLESIKHCQKANVPFLIALNKIDLPEANIEKVKKQLAEKYEILVEGYGGEIVCVPVSAKTKKGIDILLEMILLLSEMQMIKSSPLDKLEAVVIESKMDRFKGPLASVIVRNGNLKKGEEIYSLETKGKIRALYNDLGQELVEAGPGTPVEILGFEKVPLVGSNLSKSPVFSNLPSVETPMDLAMELPEIKPLKLNVILKTDTFGSLEAIEKSLSGKIELIIKDVGDINESDVLDAKSNKAIVVGFNVKIPGSVKRLADNERILVTNYQIIYLLLKELGDASFDIDKIKVTEKILGEAKILAIFPSGKHKIAGVKITQGRLARNDTVRIVRIEDELGKAKIISLKHGKEDIQKAEKNLECGLVFDASIDFQIGDMIISYRKTT